ncbi:MAG: sensor histidine kinase, partial [Alphaproteobacteria bacterium]
APVALQIGELIEETDRIMAPLAAARGITIDRRLAADLPVIHADRRALKQVVINLISNAVKFTPEKGRITIRVAGGGAPGGIEITIADSGSGIAPEHLPHVTEPFYRAGDAYTTGPASGAGLGLSIAHGLLKAHGGSLDIASHPGRGTTVTLRFPPMPPAA